VVRLLKDLRSEMQQMFRCDTEASTISIASQRQQTLGNRNEIGLRQRKHRYLVDIVHCSRSYRGNLPFPKADHDRKRSTL
jgi:hypothetical protein